MQLVELLALASKLAIIVAMASGRYMLKIRIGIKVLSSRIQ